ncbi:hypothetical protein M271_34525 [Streptomyces rapamycinicus NRRL 5491]|nr:hypothetical protein M271_34525 [Streptomyces rapamycinicus NRRL 5491]
MRDGCGDQYEFVRVRSFRRRVGILASPGEEFGFECVQGGVQVVDDVQSAESRLAVVVLADQEVDVVGGDEDVRGRLRSMSFGEQGDDQSAEGVECAGADQAEALSAGQVQDKRSAVFHRNRPFWPWQRRQGRASDRGRSMSWVLGRLGRDVGGVCVGDGGEVVLVVGEAECADDRCDGEVLALAAAGTIVHSTAPPNRPPGGGDQGSQAQAHERPCGQGDAGAGAGVVRSVVGDV